MLKKCIDFIPKYIISTLTITLILWLTLAPRPVGEVEIPLFAGADKIVHAIMFGFLTWALYIDFQKIRKSTPGVVATVLCGIAATLFGISIEFAQWQINIGRSMENADMVADAAGAICVATGIILFNRQR